ncbi:hypothetical protein, partial [Metapseudomonas otitidis]
RPAVVFTGAAPAGTIASHTFPPKERR